MVETCVMFMVLLLLLPGVWLKKDGNNTTAQETYSGALRLETTKRRKGSADVMKRRATSSSSRWQWQSYA